MKTRNRRKPALSSTLGRLRVFLGLALISFLSLGSALAEPSPAPTAPPEASDERPPEKIPTFRENWILTELRSLRHDMMEYRNQMNLLVTDRELEVADKAMSYASSTVLTFFYVVAVAGGILAIVGWRSVNELKENVRLYAEREISNLTQEYEQRLAMLEQDLRSKSETIATNQEEIERTNEVHSLWLKAGKEVDVENKISIYDHILDLRPEDTDALAWKADAALEMGEPRWAMSLCEKVLAIDPDNPHALYQHACSQAELGDYEQALKDIARAIELQPAWARHAKDEPHFKPIADDKRFLAVVGEDVA